MLIILVFFYKQKTAYEMRISDWSSDVCSSDLGLGRLAAGTAGLAAARARAARRRQARCRARKPARIPAPLSGGRAARGPARAAGAVTRLPVSLHTPATAATHAVEGQLSRLPAHPPPGQAPAPALPAPA